MMVEILEEQNILVESKYFLYGFSVDYINDKFFVSVYDKEKKKLVFEDHEITRRTDRRIILELIDKEPGTIIKQNNMKFLIRNHDKVVWTDELRGRTSYNIISTDSVYDTRYSSNIPLLSQIAILLKEAWLQI